MVKPKPLEKMVRISFTVPVSIKAEWLAFVNTLYPNNEKALARVIRQAMTALIHHTQSDPLDQVKEMVDAKIEAIKLEFGAMKGELLQKYAQLEIPSPTNFGSQIVALLRLTGHPLSREEIFTVIHGDEAALRRALTDLHDLGQIELDDANKWGLTA